MTRTTITIHVGDDACYEALHGPSEGARIEIHHPNAMDPLVITVEQREDDWIALIDGKPEPHFRARPTFPQALDDALSFTSMEAETYRE